MLLLLLSGTPMGAAALDNAAGQPPAVAAPAAEKAALSNIQSNIPKNKSAPATSRMIVDLSDQPAATSALDLSLFGIISLGIIGLFWIRRHTAEL